jgi:hypothetical protein
MRSFSAAAAVAFALVSGSAFAQSPPSQSPGDERGADRPAPPSSDDRDGDWGRGSPHPHRPMPSKAARIRIESGDLEIGVKCPEDESLKTCADFTLQLIDKVANLPHH